MSVNAKSALVLEGGAMRGLFSAGILDVFMDNGIWFSHMIGVSAGAVFGCSYKSRQRGRTIRYNLNYINDWRYCSIRSFIKTGDLYGADFCYREIPEKLDPFDSAAFTENPMSFDVVATDIETGKAIYHRAEDGLTEDLQWIRASASMPVVSQPVLINGKHYLDGGIADPIPYQYAKDQGFDKIVVILTQPRDFIKTGASSIYHLFYHGRNRGLADMMEGRASLYNNTRKLIFNDEKENKVFVIAPGKPLDVKRTEKNSEKLHSCYETGIEAGRRILPALTKYLNS